MNSKLQGKIFEIDPSIFSCSSTYLGTKSKFFHQKAKQTFVVLFVTNSKFLETSCGFV